MIPEQALENLLVREAKRLGCFVRKIQFIANRGCPDRLIITPNGQVFWVEMKTTKGRLSAHQQRQHMYLVMFKQKVVTLSTRQQVDEFLGSLGDHCKGGETVSHP